MDLMLFIKPLVGGILLGCSALLLLAANGRIAGISGILSGMLTAPKNDKLWRFLFIAGMIAGGVLAVSYGDIPSEWNSHPALLIVAGLLVGIGTRIGNGCTSGHSICGMGRLSVRSIVVTIVFMAVAGITVFVRLHLL